MTWGERSDTTTATLTTAEQSVLSSLLYADIFKYPLSREELLCRANTPALNEGNLSDTLDRLVAEGYIHRLGDFYSVQHDETLAGRREEGNRMARGQMRLARRIGRLIGHLPYVRMVTISGSLSKDYMDKKSDLDFFLITRPGRLWFVKGYTVFIKRVVLLGNYRFFCVNYLIDDAHLEIEEKNIFTATELLTTRPVAGKSLYGRFMEANGWVHDFYPHCKPLCTEGVGETGSWLQRFAEFCFNNALGNWVDRKAKSTIQNRIQRRYAEQYSEEDLELAFKSTEHVSKYHEKNFQRKVHEMYRAKINEFEHTHQVKLAI